MDTQVEKLKELFSDLLKTSNEMINEVMGYCREVSLEGLDLTHSYELDDGAIETAKLVKIVNNKGSINVYDSCGNVYLNMAGITIPQRIDILAALKSRQFRWTENLVHNVSKSCTYMDDSHRTFYTIEEAYEDMKSVCMNMIINDERMPIKILFKDNRAIECVYDEDSIIYEIKDVLKGK